MDVVSLSDQLRRGARLTRAAALAALCVGGCSEPPAAQNNAGTTKPPIMRERPKPGEAWTVSTLDAQGGGLHIALASAPSGQLGAVYFPVSGQDDGPCEELNFDSPPLRVRWPLTYAQLEGQQWVKQVVANPLYVGQPTGLDLGFYADGTPVIATMTGDPLAEQRYCGVNDVGLMARRGAAWQTETAVTNSGQARTGEAGSDFGEVVGYYPSLAFDRSGQPAVAYKDVHSGSIQSDDRRRADLELAWRQGGSWRAIPVDYGTGAGNFNKLAFDLQDRPVIAYYVPTESLDMTRQGIWATRSSDAGQTWERVQLYNLSTSERPALAIHPQTGAPHVLYYQARKGYPTLATLTDDDKFGSLAQGWSLEDIGDSRYDEGYSPAIAFSPEGTLAVAYYRCTKSIGTLGDCTSDDDALIFAWRDGQEWVREVVDEGDVGGVCGQRPSLTFDADGYAVIAYRCEVEVEGRLQSQIKFARRKSLP